MLYLDPRVHLDENVLAGPRALGFHQELHRPGAGVIDRLGEPHSVAAQRLAQGRVDIRRRCDLDHLLVAALDRAVALEQVHRVAPGIGEDLHLDMPRPAYRLLDEHRRVAECSFRLPHGRTERLSQHGRIIDPTHAATTAAGHRLDEHWKSDFLRAGDERVDIR